MTTSGKNARQILYNNYPLGRILQFWKVNCTRSDWLSNSTEIMSLDNLTKFEKNLVKITQVTEWKTFLNTTRPPATCVPLIHPSRQEYNTRTTNLNFIIIRCGDKFISFSRKTQFVDRCRVTIDTANLHQ